MADQKDLEFEGQERTRLYLATDQDAPTFVEVPKQHLVARAWAPLQVELVLSGMPTPSVRLHKDALLVSPHSARVRVYLTAAAVGETTSSITRRTATTSVTESSSSDLRVRIRIDHLMPSDAGIYSIFALNDAGTANYMFTLHVDGMYENCVMCIFCDFNLCILRTRFAAFHNTSIFCSKIVK